MIRPRGKLAITEYVAAAIVSAASVTAKLAAMRGLVIRSLEAGGEPVGLTR